MRERQRCGDGEEGVVRKEWGRDEVLDGEERKGDFFFWAVVQVVRRMDGDERAVLGLGRGRGGSRRAGY